MIHVKEKKLGKRDRKVEGSKIQDVEHRRMLTALIKVVMMCPMDDAIKKIMILRVWGADPKKFEPLTSEQVAFIKNRCQRQPTQEEVDEIEDLERQGKFMCEQFLLSQHAQETIEKFNEDFEKNKAHIFAKTPFEQKSFKV